jgi:hypothetical protein
MCSMTISLGLGKPSYQAARSSCQHREVKKVTATILFGAGCAAPRGGKFLSCPRPPRVFHKLKTRGHGSNSFGLVLLAETASASLSWRQVFNLPNAIPSPTRCNLVAAFESPASAVPNRSGCVPFFEGLGRGLTCSSSGIPIRPTRERLFAFARSLTLQDVFQADVLVELRLVNTQAAADELMHLSIRRKAVRQSRIPRKWHMHRPAVRQEHGDFVAGDLHPLNHCRVRRRRKTHAIAPRNPPNDPPPIGPPPMRVAFCTGVHFLSMCASAKRAASPFSRCLFPPVRCVSDKRLAAIEAAFADILRLPVGHESARSPRGGVPAVGRAKGVIRR